MDGDTLDDAPLGRPTPLRDDRRARASVLIVEPDPGTGRKLRDACVAVATTTLCPDFDGGRSELDRNPPNVLITNLRLEAYNGLHLLLLSQRTNLTARRIVHTDRPDYLLIGEALGMGAFYERTERLLYSVLGYVVGALPSADRRNPQQLDRRTSFRGGRRLSDLEDCVIR